MGVCGTMHMEMEFNEGIIRNAKYDLKCDVCVENSMGMEYKIKFKCNTGSPKTQKTYDSIWECMV